MLYFENDYNNGAHSAVLQHLIETNNEPLSGYGTDKYSLLAADKIRNACGCNSAEVYFLAGGTQTNAVVISSVLNRGEGVISAETGHINTHEAGAIEYTGHKVITLKGHNGKIDYESLNNYLNMFFEDKNNSHMVLPAMVYISQPTEYGTLYSRNELERISRVCHSFGIKLFVDGARLGYALACDENDVSMADIASCADVFYIGGTKVGALCGEAVVFPNKAPKNFVTLIKQQGALLAKGRLTGVQFDALFTDDLYVKISKNAIVTANRLRNTLLQKGYRLYINSPTNQIFVILSDLQIKELEKSVKFSFWEKYDEQNTVVRFATSWATDMSEVEKLGGLL